MKIRILPLGLAIAGGLALGAAGGWLLAPRLAPATATPATAAAVAHPAEKPAPREAPAAAAQHTIDNLVVNPAGTGGTRFLVVSIALALRDAEAAGSLKARDAELRDAVIGVLGRKSVTELADPDARPALRRQVATVADSLLGRPAVDAVYFPNYVIQ